MGVVFAAGLGGVDSNLNPPPFCIRSLFSLSHSLFCRGLLCLVRSYLVRSVFRPDLFCSYLFCSSCFVLVPYLFCSSCQTICLSWIIVSGNKIWRKKNNEISMHRLEGTMTMWCLLRTFFWERCRTRWLRSSFLFRLSSFFFRLSL